MKGPLVIRVMIRKGISSLLTIMTIQSLICEILYSLLSERLTVQLYLVHACFIRALYVNQPLIANMRLQGGFVL